MSTARAYPATFLALALIGLVACGEDSIKPPTADSLQAVGSTAFTGFTDTQLTSPLQVRVMGSDGNPFTGQPVTWAVTAGGGTLSTTSSTTDASGTASVAWTLGPFAGEHIATATAAGVGSVTFTATATFQTLEPSVDIPIEGVIEVERIVIPAGVTVTVTGPTTITSAGETTIAGTLEGDCQQLQIIGGASGSVGGRLSNACDNVVAPPNPPGLDFTIDGQLDISGDVRSSGDIFISNSPEITLAAVHMARQQGISAVAPMLASASIDPCNIVGGNIGGPADPPVKAATGEDGAKGRSIALACSGDFIAGGDGGADTGEGGEPGDQDDDAGDDGGAPASSSGGNGGDGGDWALITNQQVRFDGYTIYLNRGGDGRDATATATNEGQSAVADGGDGGEGGGLQITAGGGIVITSAGLRIIVGGGGHGGDATATGMKGRDGNGEAAQNGGNASATGGHGGGTSPGRLNASGAVTGTINVQLLRHPVYSDGGRGGTATANAGDGGNGGGDHPDGARGGTMTAHGGTGGDIQTQAFSGAFVGVGGDGGDVVIGGGNGGKGYDYCADPARESQGGDGGMGGSVGAGTIPGVGGDGGPGTLEDGDEGEIRVKSGTGNGGDGNDGEAGGGGAGMKGSDAGFATQFENGNDVERADDTNTFEDGKAGDTCNTPPTLNNTEASTPRNTPVTVSIPYTDAEADEPDLSSIFINGLDAAEGSVSGVAYTPAPGDPTMGTITFTFTPALDFVGTATFLVGVTDQRGELATTPSNVTVTVTDDSSQLLLLTTGSTDPAVGILRFHTGQAGFLPPIATPPEARGLALAPDGSVVVVTGSGSVVKTDPMTGLPVPSFGSGGTVTDAAGLFGLAILPDGTLITTNQVTGELVVRSSSGAELERHELGPGLDQILATQDGSKLFIFQRNDAQDPLDDELLVLDGGTREVLQRHGDWVFQLLDMAISPDGKDLVFTSLVGDGVGGVHSAFRVYDITAMRMVEAVPTPVPEAGEGSGGVGFSPNGTSWWLTDQANARALAFATDCFSAAPGTGSVASSSATCGRTPGLDITGVGIQYFRIIVWLDSGLGIFIGPPGIKIYDPATGAFTSLIEILDLFAALLVRL